MVGLSKTAALAVLLLIANTACAHKARLSLQNQKSIHHPTPDQRALGIYQPFSDADIEFMTGMIPHHAQAVIMAGWAPTHGARSDLAILCERILVGQLDEIHSMQQWLADRGQPVPAEESTRMPRKMNGT